jgi:hypothetical protein
MSVKQLHFYTEHYDTWIEKDGNKIVIIIDNKSVALDRNQAHLLMLYLQEHLK